MRFDFVIFSSNFYGEPETYLTGMWNALADLLKEFLQHCVAFDGVDSAADFVAYMKRCQVDNSLFFNGSNDKPLAEQLKALYVKQAFIEFAFLSQKFRHEGADGAARLQAAFRRFVKHLQIDDTSGPTWPVAATGSLSAVQIQ